MRSMMLPFLVVAVLPQAQHGPLVLVRTLTVSTARPRVDLETAFKLSGAGGGVNWDFGDGRPPQVGGSTATHIYRSAGTFQVKATVGTTTSQQSVTVVEPRRVLATPAIPLPGKAVVLTLEEALGKRVHWQFGDGTAPVEGGASLTHTFLKAGDYTVTVQDAGVEPLREFTLNLPVGQQGPGAPFGISYLALRWEDGTTERSVSQGASGLVAYADLKYEGTGQLQAEWVVDGQVQRAVSQQLGFAKLTTLRSGQALVTPLSVPVRTLQRQGHHTLASTVPGEFQIELPTHVAGEHKVTLKVLQPRMAFPVPVIRYFVKLGGEAKGPVVQSLSPVNAKPGEEVELILTGTGFSADMTLNLGKDIAVLGAPKVLSPERAVVKVFIAPTAQPGTRVFQARKAGGSPSGSAHLQIVPLGKAASTLAIRPGSAPTALAASISPVVPTQPMSGSLPGGKPGPKFQGTLTPTPKPAGALGLTKVDGKGKQPLGGAVFRAVPVDLAKITRVGSGFSTFVPAAGGKRLGFVLDAGAGRRKEKVLACTEGQKLHLSQITLGAPSYSLIGVNTSGEFQSDDLPVLRDATQFTWKEKNPGTSESFELRFFNAKDGSLLKTVPIPGNRNTFDVTPAFVQELGSLRGTHTLPNLASSGGKVIAASQAGKAPATASSGAKAQVNPSGKTTKAFRAPAPGAASSKQQAALTTAHVPALTPDPDIPAIMRQKADVVWQVVGFRNYPCLSAEELKAQKTSPEPKPSENSLTLLRPGPSREPASPTSRAMTLKSLQARPGTLKAQAGTINAQSGTLQAQSGKPPLGFKPAGSGTLPGAGHSPALDKPISTQGQAPTKAADMPKVYQTIAAEVSRSEVWPIRMPVTPQGVNPKGCTISQSDPKVTIEPNRAAHEGGKPLMGLLTSTTLSSKPLRGVLAAKVGAKAGEGTPAKPKTSADLNTYVSDEVLLSGTFDLGARVPYRLIPAVVKSKGYSGGSGMPSVSVTPLSVGSSGALSGGSVSVSSGQGGIDVSTVDRVTFKNVFLDWGDGTLEPFHGSPVDSLYASGCDYYSAYVVRAGEYRHTYARAATYRVKVFVLSDEDMVRGDTVSEVSQALTPTQSFQGVFTRLSASGLTALRGGEAAKSPKLTPLVARSGPSKPKFEVAVAFGTHRGEFLDMRPSAAQAMARAYVVYCQDFMVYNRTDPCTLLPVHLVSAQLDFPKDDASGTKPLQGQGGAPQSPKALQTAPVGKPREKAASARPSLASQTAHVGLTASSASAHAVNVTPVPEGPNAPSTTTCNLFYSAKTRIKYYGRGNVRVIWKVDERQVGSREVTVMSPQRLGLNAEEARTCQNPLLGEEVMNSPALPVDSLGRHIATVEAYVLPEKTGDLDAEDLTNLGHLAAGHALSTPISPRLVHTLVDTLGKGGTGKPQVHLGLLNPSQAPGQVAYVPLHQVANLTSSLGLQRASTGLLQDPTHLQPPYRVETRGVYEVKAAKDGVICNLFFPTKGGIFPVTNLGKNLTLTPDGPMQRASGKGLLVFNLRAGTASDALVPFPIDLKFSDWQVDGVTVAKGAMDIQPNQAYKGPGVLGTLKRVRGAIADKNAPQDLMATLSLSPIDTSMVLMTMGSPQPVWVAEAPVTTQGDWIAKGLKLETTRLGPTPWAFSAENIVIDLSGTEGVDPKGGKSSEWVGVSLGTVTLNPIVIQQGGEWVKPLPHPTDWTLEGLGVKGSVDVGPWQTDYRVLGHMAVGKIHFEGTGQTGNYTVKYKDVEIRSPWFKDPIKGNASLVATDGYKLDLDELHAASRPTLAGGPMALDALNLQVIPIKDGGWVMQGRARISLKAEGKPLAIFDADRVGFGLDGLMYFGDDGARSTTVTLNRASYLGPTPADLQNVVLTGGATPENPLSLKVNAKLRLSENPVIPGTPVTMNFGLKAAGAPGAFTASDVKVDPFNTEVAFPLGSPSLKAKINTNYQPGATAGGAPAMASNRFSGEVDLSMFGGSPVKAQFVLGYANGKDYFATRVDVPLGPSGIVIYPEVVSLFRLSGGFAYNFGLDVFKDGGSIVNAKPDFKGDTLFLAGARLGSSDGFIYTLDGQLVVKSSGAARMDFGAWLLTPNPSGNAPLRGCLEYSGGNFDGRIWGGFSFMGDVVALDLGQSEQAAACSLHFGGGNWHIYAGNRDGQRIVGRLMGNSSNAYLMLGNEVGLAVGGGSTWYMGAGVGVKAYAKGWMDMGLQITRQPKIIGDFGAGLEAGVCAFGHCVSAGVGANIHAEALPISLSASCCVDLPWPLSDICFTVKM